MTVAITGATGYVGGVIAEALAADGSVLRLVRRPMGPNDIAWSFDADPVAVVEQLNSRGVRVLVHAAWDMQAATLTEMQAGSVAGTRRLLDAATAAGVERVVFISTISAFDGARSAYGRAKLEAEQRVRANGGVVLRLGLVHGPSSGGMFGTLRAAIRKSRFVPMIGDGRAPQYLLSEAALAQAIRRAARGEFDTEPGPITLADPTPVPFRALLARIAGAEGRPCTPIPLPWPVLFAALRVAEAVGLRPGVRSDSVISFVFQDPAPDFAPMRRLGLSG